jgi:hypothetical protein
MCGLVGKQSFNSFQQIAKILGCAEGLGQVDCMRGKTTVEVQNAAKSLTGAFPPKFAPVIDEKLVFSDYPTRGEKGLFVKAVRSYRSRLYDTVTDIISPLSLGIMTESLEITSPCLNESSFAQPRRWLIRA